MIKHSHTISFKCIPVHDSWQWMTLTLTASSFRHSLPSIRALFGQRPEGFQYGSGVCRGYVWCSRKVQRQDFRSHMYMAISPAPRLHRRHQVLQSTLWTVSLLGSSHPARDRANCCAPHQAVGVKPQDEQMHGRHVMFRCCTSAPSGQPRTILVRRRLKSFWMI